MDEGIWLRSVAAWKLIAMTSHHPVVEIVLPTFRAGPWLDQSVQSVLVQSVDDWHLTFVDDASPDDTVDRIRAWCEEHPSRMDFIQRDRCGGAAAARMTAVEATNSEYIGFIDQDDRWKPEKLEHQFERFASCQSAAAIHTDVEFIDQTGRIIHGRAQEENQRRATIDYRNLDAQLMSANLYRINTIRIVSSMVRRKQFLEGGGFDTTLSGGEDWEFWVRFSAGFGIDHIQKPLIERRLHAANTVSVRRYQRACGALQALAKIHRENPHLRSHSHTVRTQRLWDVIRAARRTRRWPKLALRLAQLFAHYLRLTL
ncbi:MAG: glycosyltransferase [bacterium]|nr:glycosyltransferase [bacterium]